jgi:chromosome segregation ATPase
MSLSFFSAWIGEGGKEAMRGVQTALQEATPGISGRAGAVVAESKVDDIGKMILRMQHAVDEARAHYDPLKKVHDEKSLAADNIAKKIAAFKATIDAPETSDTDRTTAQSSFDAYNRSLNTLLDALETNDQQMNTYKHDLDTTNTDLAQANALYKQKTGKLVTDAEETHRLQQQIDAERVRTVNATQREQDAKVLAGLSTEGTEDNPAVAHLKATLAKAKDATAEHELKVGALTATVKHGDDDPIVAAAMAEVHGTTSSESATDRLARLRAAA